MREHPILFSGEMVRAILDGTKTQTRRVVKPQPSADWLLYFDPIAKPAPSVLYYDDYLDMDDPNDGCRAVYACPYGKVGDRLWVREAFTGDWRGNGIPSRAYVNYRADGEIPEQYRANAYWRPSIHMPRWASRVTLEITGVRVERLFDISQDDAIAEGVSIERTRTLTPRGAFAITWDEINKKRGYGWEGGTNPWVWVIEFRRITA